MNKKKYLLWRAVGLLIVVAGIVLDILTKQLAVTYLKGQPSIVLIPDVLQLTYVENRGAIGGIFADNRWVFLTVSAIAIVVIPLYVALDKSLRPLPVVCLSMILSGGIGNMIERVGQGYVVDFVDVCLINFPVFNLADSLLTVGAFLLIFLLIAELFRENRRGNAS